MAARAGQRHVEDMVRNGFRGHFGSDGSVPEQRYTEAGGEHLVHENATCFFDGKPRELDPNPTFSAAELEEAERVYMAEKPPADGHRLNILKPAHNRLGIGLAKARGHANVCVAQEFVDAYGDYDELPLTARPGARVVVSGRVEAPATFGAVGIAHGPLPSRLGASELNERTTYMMPSPDVTYHPKGFVTPREVKVEGGRFSIELFLDRGAGRYAVSVWGRMAGSGGSGSGGTGELGMLSLRTILVR